MKNILGEGKKEDASVEKAIVAMVDSMIKAGKKPREITKHLKSQVPYKITTNSIRKLINRKEIKPGEWLNEGRPMFQEKPNELAYLDFKKWAYKNSKSVKGILSKTEGAKEVWITERGTSFGYNTLVVDFTGLNYMLDNYACPIILDATHSVQKPGGNGNSSGGNRDYVPGLSRAASALGIGNFFLEVHPDPDNAPSDGPNMLRLDDFEKVVRDIIAHQYTIREITTIDRNFED